MMSKRDLAFASLVRPEFVIMNSNKKFIASSKTQDMNLLCWADIESWILLGIEGTKIEIKREFVLDSKPSRAKFSQLITAIANAPGGAGYFIIGVIDKRDRKTNSLDEISHGLSHDYFVYCRYSTTS